MLSKKKYKVSPLFLTSQTNMVSTLFQQCAKGKGDRDHRTLLYKLLELTNYKWNRCFKSSDLFFIHNPCRSNLTNATNGVRPFCYKKTQEFLPKQKKKKKAA